jgi:predicted GIY-YIG superfamily endonuclease
MAKPKIKLEWVGYHKYFKANVDTAIAEEKKAGVYKLSLELENGNLKPFYVGQTDDLKKRLNEHLLDSEQNECIKKKLNNYICYFKFAFLSQKEERDGAEKALYENYTPDCNDKDAIPSEPDIEINPN